eukprot:GHVQ01034866.1.p1 GENE.GHVQ01034866.1~~GHVQ01034866.1.p1  ORF type:complete len:343 (+),score=70.37 GHVQ01034866.1:101-1129(+)
MSVYVVVRVCVCVRGFVYVVCIVSFSGIAVSAGSQFAPFPRVDDDTVYLTERYDTKSFSYLVPLREEGTHTITFKFSEVYFDQPNQKVFDVKVGGTTVIKQLDIFAAVGGRGIPHDEYVEVERSGETVYINGWAASEDAWDISSQQLLIDFVLLPGLDNPKVNAIVIHKGSVDSVPKLKPVPVPDNNEPIHHVHHSGISGGDDVSSEYRHLETVEAPGQEDDFDDIIFDQSRSDGSGIRVLLTVTVGGSILIVALYCFVSKPAKVPYCPKTVKGDIPLSPKKGGGGKKMGDIRRVDKQGDLICETTGGESETKTTGSGEDTDRKTEVEGGGKRMKKVGGKKL